MYAVAGGEMVFPQHLQGFDLFKDSHHQCYLQSLEDELVATLNSTLFTRNVSGNNQDDDHLSFLGDSSMSNLLTSSNTPEFELEEEFFLKMPETIPEEPILPLDPAVEAISVISNVEDIMSCKTMKTDTLEANPLLDEIYYELKKDLLEEPPTNEQNTKLIHVEFPAMQMVEVQTVVKEDGLVMEGLLQKSVSSGCLMLENGIDGWLARSDLVGIQEIDMGAAIGMRRAYSEGDIKTLDNRIPQIPAVVCQLLKPSLLPMVSFKSEERMQKLCRYMKKKSKRNFGKKIKYACRKALADSQPRVRGRFAKTEESEATK